jgi:hypothetical protein
MQPNRRTRRHADRQTRRYACIARLKQCRPAHACAHLRHGAAPVGLGHGRHHRVGLRVGEGHLDLQLLQPAPKRGVGQPRPREEKGWTTGGEDGEVDGRMGRE